MAIGLMAGIAVAMGIKNTVAAAASPLGNDHLFALLGLSRSKISLAGATIGDTRSMARYTATAARFQRLIARTHPSRKRISPFPKNFTI